MTGWQTCSGCGEATDLAGFLNEEGVCEDCATTTVRGGHMSLFKLSDHLIEREYDPDYILIELCKVWMEEYLCDLSWPEQEKDSMALYVALWVRCLGLELTRPVTLPKWSADPREERALSNENAYECGKCGHRTHTAWSYGNGTVEFCAACNTIIAVDYPEEDE